LGILEKTRALLISKLGGRIEDASADSRALKDLILELEKARSDIVAGLEALEREVEYLELHERGAGREASIEKIEADIAEGEAELRRVEQGLEDVRETLTAASPRRGGDAPKDA
jgi:chromosome segregation ATPase